MPYDDYDRDNEVQKSVYFSRMVQAMSENGIDPNLSNLDLPGSSRNRSRTRSDSVDVGGRSVSRSADYSSPATSPRFDSDRDRVHVKSLRLTPVAVIRSGSSSPQDSPRSLNVEERKMKSQSGCYERQSASMRPIDNQDIEVIDIAALALAEHDSDDPDLPSKDEQFLATMQAASGMSFAEMETLEMQQPGILEQMWEEEQRTPGVLRQLCEADGALGAAPEPQEKGDIEQGGVAEQEPVAARLHKRAKSIRQRKQGGSNCCCYIFVGLLIVFVIGYFLTAGMSDYDSEDW